jgi:hypothetical protein
VRCELIHHDLQLQKRSVLPHAHCINKLLFRLRLSGSKGHAVAQLVETLCYEQEGRGFDSRLGYCIFQLT